MSAAGMTSTSEATGTLIGHGWNHRSPPIGACGDVSAGRGLFPARSRPEETEAAGPPADAGHDASVIGAARPCSGRRGIGGQGHGSAIRIRGRPVVAVTGMGIITSLGQGQADNWDALSSGHFRHPRDHAAFRPTGFRPASPARSISSTSRPIARRALLCLRAEGADRSAWRRPASAGRFHGPLFLALPPVEPGMERQRRPCRPSPPADHPGDRL